jgi:hypothetical protein
MRAGLLFLALILSCMEMVFAQPIVTPRTIGSTYYERQSLGSLGRLTALDTTGGVHYCWTSSSSTGTNRHGYYNYLMPSGILIGDTNGLRLEAENSAAYVNMSLFPDGRCTVVFHGGSMGSTQSYIYYDFFTGGGAFQGLAIPNDPQGGTLICPHVTVQPNAGQVATIGMGSTGFTGLFFSRLPYTNVFTFNNWVMVDTPKVIAQDLATSPVSNRVALVWAHPIGEVPEYPDLQFDNDIYAVISPDGSTWNFNNPMNVTDFIGGEPPHSDSVRGYNDLSTIFDRNDHLHVTYVVVGYWMEAGEPVSTWGSMIYHWDEESGTHSIITGNIYAEGDPGYANESIYCLPNLGINPTNGDLYCTWVEFSDPSDTADNGYLNGEIYASGSADGGVTWGTPVNLTNTSTPGAVAGQCLSENYSSLAAVVNDTLHVFYEVDLYAGQADFAIPSTVTQNPLYYMKIPANLIPLGGAFTPEITNLQPQKLQVAQNYPNPFNSTTNLTFSINQPSKVTVTIYNIMGQEVSKLLEQSLSAGQHSVPWEAGNTPSGIYFARIQTIDDSQTCKMLLLK